MSKLPATLRDGSMLARLLGIGTLSLLAFGMLLGSALGFDRLLPGGGGYGYSGYYDGYYSPGRSHASISMSPSQPSAGRTVKFTSLGYAGTATWDLDEDGTYGEAGETGPQVERAFEEGDHTVRLRTSDEDGGAVSDASTTFNVHARNMRPTVQYATITPVAPRVGSEVSLTGSASDPDGEVSKIDVDVDGDGTWDYETAPARSSYGSFSFKHTYATAGEYEGRLRVTDDAGDSTIERRTIHVHEGNRAPSVGFDAPLSPRIGQTVTFSPYATDPDGKVAKYEWDLDGDGTYEVTKEPPSGTDNPNPGPTNPLAVTKTYTTAGPVDVGLRVTDDAGTTTRTVQTLFVHEGNDPPTVSLYTSPSRPRVDQVVSLSTSGSDPDGQIVEYAYDLDNDGAFDDATSTSSYPPVTTSFATGGDHVIRVRVTDNDGATRTAVQTLVVSEENQAPNVGSIGYSPSPAVAGQSVNLTSYSSDPDGVYGNFGQQPTLVYDWDLDGDGAFDDVTGSNMNSASHVFPGAGSYDVGVRVTDADGASATRRRTISVSPAGDGNAPPEVELNLSPREPRVGGEISVSAYANDPDGSIALYEWDLDGDGTYETSSQFGSSQNTTFTTTGAKTVGVRVTDSDDALATATQTFDVHEGNYDPVIEGLSMNPASPKVGTQIAFSTWGSDRDGRIALFEWDLDNDGSFDDGRNESTYGGNATKTFDTAGEKTVRVRATDDADGQSVRLLTFEVAENAANKAPRPSIYAGSARVGKPVNLSGNAIDPDGTIATYAWDLDDDGVFGETGEQNAYATYTFSSVGEKRVRLTVTDNEGATATATRVITAREGNEPPYVGSISFNPYRARPGNTVGASVYATDDSRIELYEWDLDGDGDYDSEGQWLSYATTSFADAGEYEVKVRVTDDDGATTVVSRTLVVSSVNLAPTGSFYADPGQPRVGSPVSFRGYGYDRDGECGMMGCGQTVSFLWDLDDDGQFGEEDGIDEVGQNVEHTFNAAGDKSVALRIVDQNGASHTIRRQISVTTQPPRIDFTFTPEEPVENDEVSFTATATDPDGQPLSEVAWDLDYDGDFDDATGLSATRTFPTPGMKRVSVRAVDAAGDETIRWRYVDVRCADCPVADFTRSVEQPAVGQDVVFDASSSTDPQGNQTIAKYEWDFDDDGTFGETGETGKVVTHKFTSKGFKVVSLRVEDATARDDVVSDGFEVGSRAVAQFSWTPAAPKAGEQVTFDAGDSVASDGATLDELAWDLDQDGAFGEAGETGETVTKTFTRPGSFPIDLRVTDSDGETDSLREFVTVVNQAPTASFTSAPASPKAKQLVTFDGTGSSDPENRLGAYAWDLDDDGDFDDGFQSTASKSFDRSGTHEVHLRVNDLDGGSDVETKTITVANTAPVAGFTFTPNPAQPGDEVTFTSTSTDGDGDITAVRWDLDGDDQYDDHTGTTAKKTFPTAGRAVIGVEAEDNAGAKTTKRTEIRIGNAKPAASFTATPERPEAGQSVELDAAGSTDPDGDAITAYRWDLDNDGQYDDATGVRTSRTFTTPGAKTIGLEVEDAGGAKGTTSGTVTVANKPPVAGIALSKQNPQVDELLTLTSTSTDPERQLLTYAWELDGDDDFNDATTKSASRSWPSDGERTVKLRVTDPHGDTDTESTTFMVGRRNQPPSASIDVAPYRPRTGSPVTLNAYAYDGDGDALTYEWDLDGDGTYGEEGDEADADGSKATATYDSEGDKTVSVKVSDGRSTATAEREFRVNGTNLAPTINAYPERSAPRVGKAVRVASYAYDEDDSRYDSQTGSWDNGLAMYEWYDAGADADCGTSDDSNLAQGATKSTYDVTWSTPGDHVLCVRVQDEGTPAVWSSWAKVPFTVRSADQNTDPTATIAFWPARPESNRPVTLWASASDADGDVLETYAWDFDGDGTYEVSGEDAYVTHTFATHGVKKVSMRVTDEAGGTGVATTEVEVVKSPPNASFEVEPFAPDAGTRATLTDRSVDDGTIETRAWDLDNNGEFNDGSGATAEKTWAQSGTYTVRLKVTDDDGESTVATKVIQVRKPIVDENGVSPGIPVPDPVKMPSGTGDVNVNTKVDPDTGKTTIQVPNGQRSQFDDGCVPLTGMFRIKKADGSRLGPAELIFRYPGGTVESYSLSDLGDENFRWKIKCATRGVIWLRYSITEPDPDNPGEEITTPYEIEIGGIELIDPQGVVHDASEYAAEIAKLTAEDGDPATTAASPTDAQATAARASAAIEGARVRLQKLNSQTGAWQTVPASSPEISPNTNPQYTGANGLFQWDVAQGTWRVLVDAPGYKDHTSEGVVIPPPKLDLHIAMERNPAPKAGFDPPDGTLYSGDELTFTSTSSDPEGQSLVHAWDTDGDGEFDDGSGTTVKRTFSQGSSTLKLRVTDEDGQTDVVTRTISVVNKPVVVDPGKDEDTDADKGTDQKPADNTDAGKQSPAETPVVPTQTPAPPTTTPRPQPQPQPQSQPQSFAIKPPSVGGLKYRTVLGRGLPLDVTCPVTCTINVSLTIDKKTARALRLGKKATKVGSSSTTVGAGSGTATVKLTSKARKAIKAKQKRVKRITLTLSVTVVAGGKTTTLPSAKLVIRR